MGANDFSEARLDALLKVSERTGIPFLVENASGLGFRGGVIGHVFRHVEPLLNKMLEGKIPFPDLLVRLGPPLTGRSMERLLEKAPIPQLIFDHWGESREPHLHPSIFVQGGMDGWITAFLQSDISLKDRAWRDTLTEQTRTIDQTIEECLRQGELTEWFFHHRLGQKIANDCAIFLGNSMPIRDFNSVFSGNNKKIAVYSNRGLSGIDGLIASAAGISLASGKETHAILGDLSTLHDVSSLSLLAELGKKISLNLWVMNNRGGEIFRLVQTAKTLGNQEWFTTPKEFNLSALAQSFEIPYLRISSRKEWGDLPTETLRQSGARIFELQFSGEENIKVRRGLRS